MKNEKVLQKENKLKTLTELGRTFFGIQRGTHGETHREQEDK